VKKLEAGFQAGAAALVLAALMAAIPSGDARAQDPRVTIGSPVTPLQENLPRSWYRNYDYGVQIDGLQNPDVGLFQVVGKPYMLVYGSGIEPAYVISLKPQEVRPVRSAEITVKTDMEVVLAEVSFLSTSPSPWANDGPAAIVFYGGNQRIRVARVPALVGETTLEELFTKHPLYRRGMDKYTPKQGAIARLKQVSQPVRIEVWFGSWCSHCQRVVPRFLKVMQAAGNPNVEIVYHGVPRQFGDYQPTTEKQVRGLPTFIFMRDGKEFTRIRGGGMKRSVEEELADILAATAPASGS
jgi:thiol-disulfide isomerase/thioredoxin